MKECFSTARKYFLIFFPFGLVIEFLGHKIVRNWTHIGFNFAISKVTSSVVDKNFRVKLSRIKSNFNLKFLILFLTLRALVFHTNEKKNLQTFSVVFRFRPIEFQNR